MINVMEHFVTDFQECKANTAEWIDKIERLLWENVTGLTQYKQNISNNK